MRSLKDLRKVVERSTGHSRISWSPSEAFSILDRIDELETKLQSLLDKRVEEVVKKCRELVSKADAERDNASKEAAFAKESLAERESQLAKTKERTELESRLIESAVNYVDWCNGEGELEERNSLWELLKACVNELEILRSAEAMV